MSHSHVEGRPLLGTRGCRLCGRGGARWYAYETVHLDTGARFGPICGYCTRGITWPLQPVHEGETPHPGALRNYDISLQGGGL